MQKKCWHVHQRNRVRHPPPNWRSVVKKKSSRTGFRVNILGILASKTLIRASISFFSRRAFSNSVLSDVDLIPAALVFDDLLKSGWRGYIYYGC